MSNQLALVSLPDFRVALPESSIQVRHDLLFAAGLITTVSTVEQQTEAAEAASKLKGWTAEIEKAREELKKPILKAGRDLDAIAAEAVTECLAEIKRLQVLLSDFHRQQEAARQAVLREQERIEREARELREKAEREEREKAAELERRRLAAEKAASEAKSEEARKVAETEAAKIREEQLEDEFASEFATPEPAPVFIAPPAVVKPKGAAVRRNVEIEVIDAMLLLAARPDLVELKPREGAIKFFLRTPGVQLDSLPGVRAWETTEIQTRKS